MKSLNLLKVLTLGILVTSIFTSVFCSEEFKIEEVEIEGDKGLEIIHAVDKSDYSEIENFINKNPNFKAVNLEESSLTHDIIDKISTTLKNLNTLNLFYCKIDDTINFKNFKNLKNLAIKGSDDVDSVTGLDKLQNLKYLEIYYCSINNTEMEAISKITNLNEIYFASVNFIDDIKFSSVSNLKKLKKMSIKFPEVSKSLLNNINKFSSLEELSVVYTSNIKKSDIKNISKLSNLKTLRLNLDNMSDLNIDDDFFSSLSSLQKLTEIEIVRSKLKKIPEFIFSLPNLKIINISSNDITKIPEKISDLKNLEYLDVNHNKLTTIQQSLNKLKNLKHVDFDSNEALKGEILTNESLEYCRYSESNNICKTKDMKCISNSNESYSQEIKYCKESTTTKKSTTNKITTTITTTKKTTTTTKKTTITKNSYSTSTNGKCGSKDGQCPSGECCSQYGYCGRSDKHCGKGCQSEFGQCRSSSTSTTIKKTTTKTTTKKTTTTKKSTSTKSSYPTSTNGKCGTKDGQCPSGECCSKYGYCGHSDKHCGKGCQSEFGQCGSSSTNTTTKKSYPITTNGKCGAKDGKCPSGECCSKYGYCGHSDKHCLSSNGCQSEFGQCH